MLVSPLPLNIFENNDILPHISPITSSLGSQDIVQMWILTAYVSLSI